MAPELYIRCPHCQHVYNIYRAAFNNEANVPMYCPMCMARFKRDEAEIVSANF